MIENEFKIESYEATLGETSMFLGVSGRRVQQLAKEGVLPKGSERGFYPLVGCVKAYVSFLKESAQGELTESINLEKHRLAKTKADSEELKLKRLKAELVPTEDVLSAWQQIVGMVKARMRSIPTKIARKVTAARTHGEAKNIIQKNIDQALKEFETAEIIIDPSSDWTPESEATDREDTSDFIPARGFKDK